MMNNNAKLYLTDSTQGLSVCIYPTDFSIDGCGGRTEFRISGQVVLECLSEDKRHELMKLCGLGGFYK